MTFRRPTVFGSYLGAVCTVGLSVCAYVVLAPGRGPITASHLLLVVLLVVGELRPIIVTRGDEDTSEVTISSTFAMTLVLDAPLAVAVAAQCGAVVLDDVRQRKDLRKLAFNVSQYALSLVAARAVFAALTGAPMIGEPPPLQPGDVPAALAAGLAFFVVNNGLITTVVALAGGQSVLRVLRGEVVFRLTTLGVLLALAPVVVNALAFSIWLVPLLLLPVAAVHRSARLAVDREWQALHDALTGLPNRTLLLERMARIGALEESERRPTAVVLIDLDHFKEINDTLGHHVGDELLRAVADRLAGEVREGDTVARLGGDEFAILAAVTGPEEAEAVARRFLDALERPFLVDDARLDIQASAGIATFPEHGLDPDTLLQRADVALYTAKETRAAAATYEPASDKHTVQKLTLLGELRDGIDRDELRLRYQPQAVVGSGAVVGVEALVRWQHPTRGLVPPDEFIPMAENTGLIAALTAKVLDAALAQVVAWRAEGAELSMSVNLSARQLTDLALPTHVARALERHGCPPQLLTLEVTESSIMADPGRAVTVLGLLSRHGVRIAIDDFGTGYSSLSYLTRLSVDELKIDKSFISAMVDDPNAEVIVRSTIELGHNLGLLVVAEGVENDETLSALQSLGCDLAQGYFISKPQAAGPLHGWLAERGALPVARPQTGARAAEVSH